MSDPGDDGAEFWDRRAAIWERRADFIDAFSDSYGGPTLERLAPEPGWRVLDIGCGPGTTTIALARMVAPDGEVVGVDISEAMVAAARRRVEAAGVTNVRVEVGDAQTAPLGEGFDAAYSRFGVMFFSDPAAAFTNIARALRADGQLAVVVWADLGDNPWMFVPTLAAGGVLGAELALPGPGEPGPFSLADEATVTPLLAGAGFDDIAIDRVEGIRRIEEREADNSVEMLLQIGPVGGAYDDAEAGTRRSAIDAVIDAVEPFRDGDGWALPGAALVITARRAG